MFVKNEISLKSTKNLGLFDLPTQIFNLCGKSMKKSQILLLCGHLFVINFFSMSLKFYDHNTQQNYDAKYFEAIVDGLKPRNIK